MQRVQCQLEWPKRLARPAWEGARPKVGGRDRARPLSSLAALAKEPPAVTPGLSAFLWRGDRKVPMLEGCTHVCAS